MLARQKLPVIGSYDSDDPVISGDVSGSVDCFFEHGPLASKSAKLLRTILSERGSG
jgi:hypothetical protein